MRNLITLGISIFILCPISLVFADTQKDIAPKDVVLIVRNYEKAYMNRNLDEITKYVDKDSTRFKSGLSEELKVIFKNYTNIQFYHWGKPLVAYVEDGVEVAQNTLYIAYSRYLSDLNEYTGNYYLKKIDGEYKIAEFIQIRVKDVEFIDKGTEAMFENNPEEAISFFKKAIEYNSLNSVAHCRLGTVYSRTGKPKEGLEELKKAVELRPNVGFYRFSLSQEYYLLGDKEKASQEMARAFTLDPGLNIFSKE